MGNKNSSSSSKSTVNGSSVPIRRRQGKSSSTTNSNIVSFSTQQAAGHTFRDDEYYNNNNIGKHVNINAGGEITRQHSTIGSYYSQSSSSSLDNDDTFSDYIQRAKNKIRTVSMSKSNVGREHISNTTTPPPPPPPPPDGAYGSNNGENQKDDEFSEFIKLAKKRLRTSSIGKYNNNNDSFKRG